LFRSIQWRITIPFVVLILVSMGITGFYLSDYFRNTQVDGLRSHLNEEAHIIAETSRPLFSGSGNGEQLDAMVKNLGAVTSARVTIIGLDGIVLGDSEEDPAAMDNHAARPEVADALASGFGESTRYSLTLEQHMLYVAVPIGEPGEVIGICRVALPLTVVTDSVNRATLTVIFAMTISAISAILVAWYIARRTTRPIRDLTDAAQNIAAGELGKKITISTGDESARLAHAFNEMSRNLGEMVATISGDRARLGSILSNIADGVIMTDGEGNIVLTNRAAGELFGFNEENVKAQPLIEAVRDHEATEIMASCLKTGRQRSAQFESAVSKRFLRAIAVPVSGDDLDGALLLFQDLTELKGLQTMRRELVGNISHEFRTPLASVKAMAETLRDGALKDEKVAADFLGRIEAEVERMTQLVAELTELSRIETGKAELRLEPTDLNALAEEVVRQMQPQADRKGLSLSVELCPDLPPVKADRERIRQVIANLVHNAVKFTDAGGAVVITTLRHDDISSVVISDNGVGITADDLPHVFERFYKADKARSGEGTGMGLAIARHIIEAHGGSIVVASQAGKGAAFTFNLPLSTNDAADLTQP
jgi:two-component system, OmpR family, phosphate regulon sensor histidine kinase PhoR